MGYFAKAIRELRTKQGLSQAELAAAVGLKRSALGNYEQGTREPDFDTVKLFADYFRVSIDELVGGQEPQSTDDELMRLREDMRRSPELRTIHSLTRNATRDELRQIEAVIRALRTSNGYEDDDTP